MDLRRYFMYANQQRDENPFYIFDADFGDKAPELLSDYTVPPFVGEFSM